MATTIPLQSEKIDELAAALVAAQSKMGNAERNARNPIFDTSYANLAAIRAACLPILNEYGIAVTQPFVPDEREPPVFFTTTVLRKDKRGTPYEFNIPTQVLGSLRTQLTHSSGQWMASEIKIVCPWGESQSLGSTISYLRRYALASLVGMATEDDDGNQVAESARKRASAQQRTRPSPQAAASHRQPGADDEGFYAQDGDFPGRDPIGDREDRKEEYRRMFSPAEHGGAGPEPASNGKVRPEHPPDKLDRDGKPWPWPPKTGVGLYSATKDHSSFAWFDHYGAEKELPRKFSDWRDEDVARACAAFEIEAGPRPRSARNGHTQASRR